MAMRLGHLSAYLRGFTGTEPEAEELEAFAKFVGRFTRQRRQARRTDTATGAE